MKKIITLLAISFVFFNINAQNEIKGTITYYFNKYQGDKPDIGAKVFLIDSITFVNLEDYESILKYNSNYVSRYLAISYSNDAFNLKNSYDYLKLLEDKSKIDKKKKPLNDKYINILDEINNKIKSIEDEIIKKEKDSKYYSERLISEDLISEAGWKEFCIKTVIPFLMIDSNREKNIKSTTVNGIGTYSITNIPDGVFYILIKSNNRTGLDIATIKGKFELKKIVLNGNVQEISHHFDNY